MARTRSITNERILEAARTAFLENGLSATTSEIAKLAEISEGTIFKRFPTKHDLFLAAMGVPKVPPFAVGLESRAGTGELHETVESICLEIHTFLSDIIPKAVLMISCKVNPADVFEAQGEPGPVRALRSLTNYFAREQQLGRIRSCDPEILARTLLGSLHFYAWSDYSGVNQRMPLATRSFIRGLVDIVLTEVECE